MIKKMEQILVETGELFTTASGISISRVFVQNEI